MGCVVLCRSCVRGGETGVRSDASCQFHKSKRSTPNSIKISGHNNPEREVLNINCGRQMLNRDGGFADYRGTSRVGRAPWGGGRKVDGVRNVHGEELGLADCFPPALDHILLYSPLYRGV